MEIKNFTKSYGSVSVYENFNLSLEEGKITCILGESGSGKTTLLNCVAGLCDYAGEIPAARCSYIFQSPRLLPHLTVYDNLKLVCKDGDKIFAMLERVRLSDKALAYPKTLSGGQAQRVAIARAFLYGGDVLLMDEPFSSLDLRLKNRMIALFTEVWRSDRRTVLAVTHDPDEAIAIAHRILVLRAGKMVFDCRLPEEPPRAFGAEDKTRKLLIDALL